MQMFKNKQNPLMGKCVMCNYVRMCSSCLINLRKTTAYHVCVKFRWCCIILHMSMLYLHLGSHLTDMHPSMHGMPNMAHSVFLLINSLKPIVLFIYHMMWHFWYIVLCIEHVDHQIPQHTVAVQTQLVRRCCQGQTDVTLSLTVTFLCLHWKNAC